MGQESKPVMTPEQAKEEYSKCVQDYDYFVNKYIVVQEENPNQTKINFPDEQEQGNGTI
jgi:hypothetical protein